MYLTRLLIRVLIQQKYNQVRMFGFEFFSNLQISIQTIFKDIEKNMVLLILQIMRNYV